eukprot:383682-Rhodomonas_salina.1
MTLAYGKSADAMLLPPDWPELPLTVCTMTSACCTSADAMFLLSLTRTSIHCVHNDTRALRERNCDVSAPRSVRTSIPGVRNDTVRVRQAR